jgi:phosphate transport system substrate-binding protein
MLALLVGLGLACSPVTIVGGAEKESPASAGTKVDANLSDYKAVGGVSGDLKFVGSDSMVNLVQFWGEGFRKFYPSVGITVEGKGSATAPPALIEGTAHFGPMSREMKGDEIAKFKEKFGYAPTALPAAIDMLAIYVHKDNPIKGLTLAQVDAIFSKTRKAGFEKDIKTWGDLGLEGAWANQPIELYGRNSASGTYSFLKEHVLLKGDYKDEVKEQPGSSAVVQAVANNKFAIGYSAIGYKTPNVNAVPLAKNSKSDFVEAVTENAYNGKYPLTRALMLYVNYEPNGNLDPVRREFIKYVFSKEGQADVIKESSIPVTSKMAARALKSVGIGQ